MKIHYTLAALFLAAAGLNAEAKKDFTTFSCRIESGGNGKYPGKEVANFKVIALTASQIKTVEITKDLQAWCRTGESGTSNVNCGFEAKDFEVTAGGLVAYSEPPLTRGALHLVATYDGVRYTTRCFREKDTPAFVDPELEAPPTPIKFP